MKICLDCGAMISPHPMHKTEYGYCDDCLPNDDGTLRHAPDQDRPKMKGKHMVVKKSQAQMMIEKRQKELGRRYY